MSQCINLKRRYGKLYRVKYEESYYAERGQGARAEDPWLMTLLCLHGHICPWGGELLAACTNNSGALAGRLMRLEFIRRDLSQVGSDGVNAVFHIEHFDEVASLMKPRKRRQMSPEQREAVRLRAQQHGFGRQLLVSSDLSQRESPPTP